MELWDVYDKNRNKIGKTICRNNKDKLEEGQYHIVVEAVIINSKDEILISRRSKNKEKYPLYWECNGGSVKSGETSLNGIIREIKEELGIKLDLNKAILYKTIRKDESKFFKDVWLFRKDVNIQDIHFTDKEVIDAKWATIEEIEKMKEQKTFVLRPEICKEEFEKMKLALDKNM